MNGATNLFSAVAAAYARHRITYPLVWDCGCGSGQAAIDLATAGARVIATDASAAQLAAASPHPRISYQQADATASGLGDASLDGVLVAAAVHWFAGDAFNTEVRRVCKSGAVVAWIGYLPLRLADQRLQSSLDEFHSVTLAPWWPAERRWVEQSYAGLAFPAEEWQFPAGLWIERHWTLYELIAHIGTWSAVQRSREAGSDPLPNLQAELKALWPEMGQAALLVRWPFMGRWGQL
ncbi:MAG: class I SAM-dependent methyltransferase [Synechococcus sp.]|nr:class I SAM-dependent methyltransferase [Synechococcus sp.]